MLWNLPAWQRTTNTRGASDIAKNPWLKKNPFMSMWLSGANRVAGTVRGHATGQAKRQATTIARNATTETMRLWTSMLTGAKSAKKRKRRGS